MVSNRKSFKEKPLRPPSFTFCRQPRQDVSQNIERQMVISILKLTQQGPVSYELIKKGANVHSQIAEELLGKMQSSSLVDLRQNGLVEVDNVKRLRLAIYALHMGADAELLTSLLRWNEFEDFAALVLEQNGWVVMKNVRFKEGGRQWQIDVVGYRKPVVVCVDCKHWHRRICTSALSKIAASQAQRVGALANSMPNHAVRIDFSTSRILELIPAVLSLRENDLRYCEGVPIVPVLRLQDFLDQLPMYKDNVRHFSRKLATSFDRDS